MAESQIGYGYAAGVPGVWEETALSSVAVQAKIGQSRVYGVDIDNQSNAAVYVKVYYAALADVVVGTTAPDEIIYVPTLTRINHMIVQADDVKMNVGMVLAAVTTGGTAGTGAPAGGNVGVRVTLDM
jgi:hypothetical protein